MAKIVLDTVTGGYDLSVINNNFDKIETEFQNKVLYRNNPVGEANTLETDVDANGKRIFNLPVPTLASEAARLQDVQNAVAGGAANLITFTPYGHVAGNNVQAAVQELIDDTTNNGVALPAFLKDSNAIVVDSIAALKAIDKTKFTKALVLGYYTKGDGGGGVYWFDASDTISADNSGTIIVATDLGRWKLALQGSVSVKQFGAKGDATTDDTAKIQAAITAVGTGGGGTVFFPEGNYKITSVLTISSQSVILAGESRFGCILTQGTASARIIDISANFCGIKSLSFIYTGTPITGATAITVSGAYATLTDFAVRSSFVGVHFTGGGAQGGKATDFEIFDYESVGLLLQSLNDVYVSNFLMIAGNATRGALGGIRLVDKVEAFICSNGDIIQGKFSLTTGVTSYTLGNRPAYCSFSNIYFDSAAESTAIDKCVETDFVGCWFSGGRSGGGFAGAVVSNSDSIRFTACRFFNCGASGCTVQATALKTLFNGCKFESNSATAGVGIGHGLEIAANTTGLQVLNCQASNGLYTGQQGYGVFINTGVNNFIISDCDLRGNATGGLLDSSTANDGRIHNNLGHNPVGVSTIVYGASPFTVTNGHTTASFHIYGGTVSDVSVGGSTIATATNMQVTLAPNQSMVITATAAPTIRKITH